jgi:predicted Zn-dependent peptidase
MGALPVTAPPLGASQGTGPASFTLANRMRVTLGPLVDARIAVVRGRIEAGSVEEPRGGHGLSALATELLASPSFGEDPRAPALVWTLREDPTSFSNFRWIEFRSVCFPEELPSLLRVLGSRLGRAVAAKDLSEEEIERIRRDAIARVREIAALAEPALWAQGLARLYPTRSPLAVPAWADRASLERVEREELLTFLAANVTPARTHLVVAGAIAAEVLEAEVRETLGAIPARGKPRRASPLSPPHGPDRWRALHLPRSERARDRIMVLVPGDRSRPGDRAATEALVRILGGAGSGGRLGQSLVATGLAEWVTTSLEEGGAPGFVAIRAASAPEHTPEVLDRMRTVLEEAAAGRFTAEELQEALRSRRAEGSAAEGDPAALAAALLAAPAAGRDADATPTLAQLRSVGKRLLANGAPLALVAGDRSRLESSRERAADAATNATRR